MNKNLLVAPLVLLFAVFTMPTKSQTKYWVKFKNKTGTPYSVSTPTAYLSQKSIARRTMYGIAVDETDLPVTPSYVTQVENVSGVTVLHISKWINGAVISTTNAAALTTINSFSFVLSSSPVNRFKVVVPENEKQESASQNKTAAPLPFSYGGSYWQNKQLGVDCYHNYGYRGQGMVIAVLDDGFENVDVNPVFDSLRNRGGLLGTRDFVSGGNSVFEDDSHGALVLSCMAAIKPNVIMGSAPMADYWLLRTEDIFSETPSEEYNWIRGAEFSDSLGADILTTSLGYTQFDNSSQNHTFAQLDGKTIHMSIAATMAARKGMFVLNAAGNGGGSGWPKISFPADADSMCTVGAIDSLNNVAGFSSVGPTADGRIKPDLMARGAGSWVSYSNGACGQSNGTSFATPILAGAVACFWQKNKTWNNMKVLDTLRNTANNASSPNNQRGWGVPQMCSIPAGIKQNSANTLNYSLYPNPFTSSITLRFEAEFEQPLTIEIYNSLGSLIHKNTIAAYKKEHLVNLEEFSRGIYLIKIKGLQLFDVKKVVKQ